MSLIHKVSDIFEERNGITSIHKSWKTVEIDKICTIQNGYALKSKLFNKDGEGTPIIRIRDISHSNPQTFYSGEFPEPYLVKKGDLLVGMDGDFNAEIWNGPVAILNQRVCRLFPNTDFINSKFLYYGIQGYLNKINENTSSTTVKHLSSRSIKEIPFPLPPRPEQDRIVAKVDALMEQVSVMQESLQRIPQLLKDFRQTLLNQNYSSDSNRVALEDCCLKIQDGAHHSPKKLSVVREKGMYPYVTSKNIRNNYMKLDTLTYVNESFHNSIYPRCKPELGDVLLTKDGASTGNVTLNEFDEPISLLSSVCLIKTDEEKLIPSYLKYFIQSPTGFSEFTGQMTGTAIKRVVLKRIKKATIPLPSIKEQQEIVCRVESLFSKADAIQQQYEALKQKIDTLPQAILHKAFKGELVEQLESDGSAEELLREIEGLKLEVSGKKKLIKKKVK